MDRRSFISSFGAALAGGRSLVSAQCTQLGNRQKGCRVGLSDHFKIVIQDCNERCWAASISGIFGYHDHALGQDVIAEKVFGLPLACRPSGPTTVLNSVLNHTWTDDDGDDFTATITGLYDPLNGVAHFDNDDLVTEMKEDRPVLYLNKTHAMVIVGLDYRKDSDGDIVAIDQVHVADPWPGKGFHVLSRAEMIPAPLGGNLMYLASVQIDS